MEVDTSCSICFDEYEVGASLRELNCKHVFHKDCIDGWLVQSGHRTCPLCVQAAIRKEDEDVVKLPIRNTLYTIFIFSYDLLLLTTIITIQTLYYNQPLCNDYIKLWLILLTIRYAVYMSFNPLKWYFDRYHPNYILNKFNWGGLNGFDILLWLFGNFLIFGNYNSCKGINDGKNYLFWLGFIVVMIPYCLLGLLLFLIFLFLVSSFVHEQIGILRSTCTFIFDVGIFLTNLILLVFTLIKNDDLEHDAECVKLKYWSIGTTIFCFLSIFQNVHRYFSFSMISTKWMGLLRIWKIFYLFLLGWWIFGNVVIFQNLACRSNFPEIFWLNFSFVMFPYFILMSILILWIVYLSSSPKVVEFLRAKGLSPTELERLRTFHFTGNEVGVMESENSSNVTNQFQPPLKDDVNEQCTIELDKVAPSEETGLPK
ncbi:E3 ubiquitin-protein ligase znrf4 [Lobulomyces angularis]|nr:E3 ubiquitin-protein ligase znrf4 [Lobulomyces angularis]